MERQAPWEPPHSAAYDAPDAAAPGASSEAAYAPLPADWSQAHGGTRAGSEQLQGAAAVRGAALGMRSTTQASFASGSDLQQMGGGGFDDPYAALQAARFGAPFAQQPGARVAPGMHLRPPTGAYPAQATAPPLWPMGAHQGMAAPPAYSSHQYADVPAVPAHMMGYVDWQARQVAYAGAPAGRGTAGSAEHAQQLYGAVPLGRPIPHDVRGVDHLHFTPRRGSGMPTHLSAGGVTDLRSLQAALQEATPGTGQVATALLSAAFPLRLPGLTAIMGRFTKQGRWAVSLEIFQVLPSLGLELDTTVCNAALAACMRGCVWHRAKQVFSLMLARGVRIDHITYYTMLSVPRRRKIWRVVIELFMHMCEADVPPLLPDCAALISSLAIDGKWLLAEKLFYYIFRHEAAFLPPPPLEQLELAVVATADLNLAFLLETATGQARAAYVPPPSPRGDAAVAHAGVHQITDAPPAGPRPPPAAPEAEALPSTDVRVGGEARPPEAASGASAQSAPSAQQSLASLRHVHAMLPQGHSDDAQGRRFSEPATAPEHHRYEAQSHHHAVGGSLGSSEAHTSSDAQTHLLPASTGITPASLEELTASMTRLGVNPDTGWQGPGVASCGDAPQLLPTQLQALGLHGEQSGPMHGELLCCNELIAAYTRLEKLDRAAHLLRCMIEAGGAFAPSAETCNRFLFSAGVQDLQGLADPRR